MASSQEVFLVLVVGEVALGLTALTFVCFSVGHDTRRDQMGNGSEKARIGKCPCLPAPRAAYGTGLGAAISHPSENFPPFRPFIAHKKGPPAFSTKIKPRFIKNKL